MRGAHGAGSARAGERRSDITAVSRSTLLRLQSDRGRDRGSAPGRYDGAGASRDEQQQGHADIGQAVERAHVEQQRADGAANRDRTAVMLSA